jgi:hypothetical protein
MAPERQLAAMRRTASAFARGVRVVNAPSA